MKTPIVNSSRKFIFREAFWLLAVIGLFFIVPANVQAAAPTTQASGVTFTPASLHSTQFTVTWANGNGTKRAVFIKQTNILPGVMPVVNNTNYTANTIFGSGTQIGATGWYCIYNNTGTSVTVTGLTQNTQYTVIVCEYNTGPTYLTSTVATNPATVTTLTAQTITFGALTPVTYGDAPITLGATASSNLSVSYALTTSTPAGAVSISGSTVTILKAGTVTITASQAGNGTYDPATSVVQTLTINKAPLTATIRDTFKTFKTANPALFTVTYTGFVYSDTKASLTTQAVCTTTATTTSVTGTYPITFSTNPASSNYAITLNTGILTIIPASQTITFAYITKTYGAADFTPTASSSSGLTTFTYTSDNPLVATIISGNIHIVGAGTANITASQAGDGNYNPATKVTTLTVNKASQNITTNLTSPKTMSPTPLTIAVTASGASGNPVTFTSSNTSVATVSGNVLTYVGVGSTIITAFQAGNSNYLDGTLSKTLQVNIGTQTIAFTLTSPKTMSPTPLIITVTASGASGNPVTFTSSNTNVATVSGNVLTYVGIGTDTIKAFQAGNSNYSDGTLSKTLVVNIGTQTINFQALPPTNYVGDPNFILVASSNAGLPVTFTSSNTNVATIVGGDSIHIVGIGAPTITATQAGNTNYKAASLTQTLNVSRGSQTITFGAAFLALGTVEVTHADIDPGATATSLLPVTYTSSDVNVAKIVNGLVHIVGVGPVQITASQAGNTNFNPATDVKQFLTVTKANQTIYFAPLNDKIYDDADIDPGASTSSGLTINYSSDNTSIASIIGGKIHITGVGTVHITASQPGNGNYFPAVSVSQILIIGQSTQTINFLTLTGKAYGDADFDPGATATSGLPITYSSDNTAVATIVSGKVHIVAPGTVHITATQAGNANYYAATDVTHVLTVYQFSQIITFGALPAMTYGNADLALSASASSSLAVTFSSDNPAVATIINGKVHIITAGSVYIIASQSGNSLYNAAPDVSQLLTINKANQSLTFGALPAKTYGDADLDPGALASTGLTVSYSSDNPAVASIYNGEIHIVSAGSANITASQAGNANYNAATNITQPLTISKAGQIITFGALPSKAYGDADFDPGAVSGSGLSVTYASDDTVVATIVNGEIHVENAGTAHITASQTGNGNYNAALNVIQVLTVGKASQTLTFTPFPLKSLGDADFDPGASVNTGLGISYSSDNPGIATIVAGQVHIVAVGVVHITASQAGDANHYPVSATQSLTIDRILQVITFNAVPVKTYGNADFEPGATSNAGLVITYSTDDATVATIVNGKIHIVGAGTVNILANQAGNSSYTAAVTVSAQLTVNKASQSITFTALPSKTYGNPDFYPVASASSGALVSFASDNGSVATIVNGKIHITGAGSANIIASQPGNDNFNEAASVTQTLIVNKVGQTITFGTLPVKTYGNADFSPGATSSSGLGITYTSDNTNVATIDNDTIHITGAGTAHITATQSGNDDYNAAANVTQLLTVNKASQTITFNTIPAKKYGDNDFDPGAVATSGLSIVYSSSNTNVAAIIDGKVQILDVGTVVITASQPGNANYKAATYNPSQTLTISKAVLTITADDASRAYGEPNPDFTYWDTGFVYDDDITSLDTEPTVITSATISSVPGEYDLIPQGGSDRHYNFVYQKGILTIESSVPSKPGTPTGSNYVCSNSAPQVYKTTGSSKATSYIWNVSPANAASINGDGITVTVTYNNSYQGSFAITVKAQNPSAQGESSDTLYVNILPLPATPAISMKGTYCSDQVGDSIIILNSQNDYIYQLDLDGSNIDTPITGNGNNIGWHGLKQGTYNITEKLCNVSVVNNLVIKEIANDATKPQLALKWNDVVICINNSDSIVSYEWFKNDSLIYGENKQYLWTQKQKGYYSVITTNSYGCYSSMSDNLFVEASLGIIYPNPAHGQFKVTFTNFDNGDVTIKIYRSNSLPLKNLTYKKVSESFEQEVDVSDLNVGIYFIEIILNGKRVIFEKLIIQ